MDHSLHTSRLATYSFRVCQLMAVSILLISIVMITTSPLQLPWTPAGLSTPILAFEFISDIHEANQLFGPSNVGLSAILNVIYWDFGYILSYSLFLASFALGCWFKTRDKKMLFCIPLILVAGLSDFFENQILLSLGNAIGNPTDNQDINFSLLRVWVNSKFTALTLVTPLLLPAISARQKDYPKSNLLFVSGVLLALTCSLCIWFTRWVAPEVLLFATAICWIIIAKFAFHFSSSESLTATENDS